MRGTWVDAMRLDLLLRQSQGMHEYWVMGWGTNRLTLAFASVYRSFRDDWC